MLPAMCFCCAFLCCACCAAGRSPTAMQAPAAPLQTVTYAGLRDTVCRVTNKETTDTLTPLSQIAQEIMDLNKTARDAAAVADLLEHVEPYMQYLQGRVSNSTLESKTAVGHIDRLIRLLNTPAYNLGSILPAQQLQTILLTLQEQKDHLKTTSAAGAAPPAAAAAALVQQPMCPPIKPAKRARAAAAARGAAAANPSAAGSNGGSNDDSDDDEADSSPAQRTRRQSAVPAIAASLIQPTPAAAVQTAARGREGAAARAAAAAAVGAHANELDPSTFDVCSLNRLVDQKVQDKLAASKEWKSAIAALPVLANGRSDGKGVLLTELPKHLQAILDLWTRGSSGFRPINQDTRVKYCRYLCKLLDMSEVQEVLGEQQVQAMKLEVSKALVWLFCFNVSMILVHERHS